LINISNPPAACGPVGATTKITTDAGPNGSESWLNCGVTGSGWNPPKVLVSEIVFVSLPDALQSSSSPFQACSQFVDLFEQYGQQFGVPGILLASFAMQESSCNPDAVGGAGEQGLMQITQDKCGDAPGGNCKDPNYNIQTGAQFFANTLSGYGGSLLHAIGDYNGWDLGMTVGSATAAASTDCCLCQNNLDYLQQFMNGWLQNQDGHSLGTYHNLDSC